MVVTAHWIRQPLTCVDCSLDSAVILLLTCVDCSQDSPVTDVCGLLSGFTGSSWKTCQPTSAYWCSCFETNKGPHQVLPSDEVTLLEHTEKASQVSISATFYYRNISALLREVWVGKFECYSKISLLREGLQRKLLSFGYPKCDTCRTCEQFRIQLDSLIDTSLDKVTV